MRRLFARLILACALLVPVAAQAQKEVNAFVYGNSLIHHLTDTDETTVPYWVHQLAVAGGHEFAVDGRWGFLRDFARDLPPEGQWSFEVVPSVRGDSTLAFRRLPYDAVIIAAANFIQYQGAEVPFDGDNPRDDTPLDATLRTIEWTSRQVPGARYFIYEGWAEMASVTSYPPNARGLREYHAVNAGANHEWFLDYVAQLQTARPQVDITLIPVASVLAGLLSEGPLADIPAQELYSDDAPHGTPNLYFLAGLITYATLYAEAPPADIALPESLHPLIRDNYPAIAAQVWTAFTGAIVPEGAAVAPETGLTDPSLAMGLNGIADWSSQQPFINVMKSARPWIGHLPGQWGGWDMQRLYDEGYINEDGWPVAIPDEVTALEAFVLTDQPPGATSMIGRYRVTWEGQGEISVGGSALDVEREGDVITFGFRPGEDLVAIRIEATNPDDPIRDIAIVREDLIPFFEAGAVFNPQWVEKIRDLRSVRFMDWMMTNGSPQMTWADRPTPGDFTYVWRGVPVEVMVDLVNQIGADPWFTLPHMADDEYVRLFAGYVHDTLDPRLTVYAEWSNEVWNFIFPQAVWSREQAIARWGEGVQDDGWMQFAGLRAAQVADIWAEVYGENAEDRLVRVVATHTGWLGLEEAMLEAELVQQDGLPAPAASFDGYAITGYFGFEIGDDEMADTLRGWIADGDADARVTQMLREGSFAELTDFIIPEQAAVARRYGFDLLMYEGGTHVAGHGLQSQDDALTAFYTRYNYTPAMASLYADLIEAWTREGGQLFNAFVDVAPPTQFGSWGALRHLDDVNPRWSTLMAYNAVPTGLSRAPGTFEHGLTVQGADTGEELRGTVEEDVLLGMGGDDVIHPVAGNDLIHGGDGIDRVVLPGVPGDYIQGWDGDVLYVLGPVDTLRLFAVEELAFEGAPGDVQSLELPDEDPT